MPNKTISDADRHAVIMALGVSEASVVSKVILIWVNDRVLQRIISSNASC